MQLNKQVTSRKSYEKYLLFKNSWVAWGIFALSLILTIALWYIVKNQSYEKAKVSFEFSTGEIKTAIQKRMIAYEQILKGGVGLFNVKNDLTRKEFKTYVENLQLNQNYPGIQGVGFAKVIYREQLKDHVRNIRNEGFPDYNIFPLFNREIYVPIVYLEPFTGRNLRAFGYDMFTDPKRHSAMSKAMDYNISSSTEPVVLVQETDVDIQKGFLVYQPVYKKGYDISGIEQRRKAILGFVYSPFRIKDLMEGIMGRQPENLIMKLYDGDNKNPSNLIYQSKSGQASKSPLFVYHTKVVQNDRIWTIDFISTKNFEEQMDSQKSFIILVSGVLISLLLFISGMAFVRNKELSGNLEKILESTGEGIYGLDKDGYCIFINEAALEMIGHSREECIQNKMHQLIHYKKENGDPYPEEECPLYLSLSTAKKMSADNEVFWKKDGISFPVEFTASPIFENGETRGSVVVFRDISERKTFEEETKRSLTEKEVMLKEIHHRVKNNMQVISSLLNLQSQYLNDKDEQIKLIFQESQNRIRSMALIHEKLYQSRDFAHINFDEYAKELLGKLMETYRQQSKEISLKIDSNGIILNMDTSISLGLILNELVTNCFKHAFTFNSSKNMIAINLSRKVDSFVLIVSDNGKGFPENIDFKNTDSLGLQLVNTLVYQINGNIDLISDGGSTFIITFPFE